MHVAHGALVFGDVNNEETEVAHMKERRENVPLVRFCGYTTQRILSIRRDEIQTKHNIN